MERRDFIKLSGTASFCMAMPNVLYSSMVDLSEKLKKEDFGDTFNWGVSSAAYQIEGAHNTDGKAPSIWDVFTNQRGRSKNNETGNIATNYYNLYEEDIGLISNMNFGNYRFSLSWPRIVPDADSTKNQKGIDFYHRVIDTCLERGIEPWVTLYHWDLPQTIEDFGGWTNREVVERFESYVDIATRAFGDKVKNWIILNEPMVFTSLGYLLGMHAPGRRGFRNFIPAVHHASLAQAQGGRIVRQNVPNAYIGSTYSCSVVEPIDNNPKNVQAAAKLDTGLNRLFLEPALGKGYPLNELPFMQRIEDYFQSDDEAKLAFDFDFHGLQYYFRVVAKHSWLPPIHAREIKPQKRDVETNQMGLEVYPKGIFDMIELFSGYEGIKNIVITESGVCYKDILTPEGKIHDKNRIKYFEHTLMAVRKAIRQGYKVNSYFVWSLTDNFEWSEGYHPRFGLVYIDYETQKRYIKDSGYWFKRFLE